MNDHPLNDPALQSLEDRLAGIRPKLSDGEFQELSYQCAFAAGKRVAVKKARRWRIAATALTVLLLVMSIPRGKELWLYARAETPTAQITDPLEMEILRHIPRVGMDHPETWNAQSKLSENLEEELEKFKRLDPYSKALTVGVMTRNFDTMQ